LWCKTNHSEEGDAISGVLLEKGVASGNAGSVRDLGGGITGKVMQIDLWEQPF
jgi:hypothetical protein